MDRWMRCRGNPCLSCLQTCSPPPQGDLQAAQRPRGSAKQPTQHPLHVLSLSFGPSACAQEQFQEGSIPQAKKAPLSPTQVHYAGPNDHQLDPAGKSQQTLGSQVHGTKIRTTVKEHQVPSSGWNSVGCCDEASRQRSGVGSPTSVSQVWKLRLRERQSQAPDSAPSTLAGMTFLCCVFLPC